MSKFLSEVSDSTLTEVTPIPDKADSTPTEVDPMQNKKDPISEEADPMQNKEDPVSEEVDPIQNKEDIHYMRAALTQARKAMKLGEVPIGAVIVYEGRIIGRGYNRRNTDKSTLSHAELSAMKKACKKLGDWRLEGCTLYCTLEPCQMCAGAIVQARVDRVVIGTTSPKSGCGGTLLNILQNENFNHQAQVTEGILKEESSSLLKQFFKELRARNKAAKKLAKMQAAQIAAAQSSEPAQD